MKRRTETKTINILVAHMLLIKPVSSTSHVAEKIDMKVVSYIAQMIVASGTSDKIGTIHRTND